MKIKKLDRRYKRFIEGYTTALEFGRHDYRPAGIARWLEQRYGPDYYSTAVGSNSPDFNDNWIRVPREHRIYLRNPADATVISMLFPEGSDPWRVVNS